MKPVDLEKAVLQVENYYQATQLASQTTLREVIGKQSLNELLAEREKVGANLREIIDEKTESWGIKVTAVEVRDVIIPRQPARCHVSSSTSRTGTHGKSNLSHSRV